MIINALTPDVEKYEIFDCKGYRIPYVTFFDTETNEIELAVRVIPKEEGNISFLSELNEDGVPCECLIRFKLTGAYAKCKEENES